MQAIVGVLLAFAAVTSGGVLSSNQNLVLNRLGGQVGLVGGPTVIGHDLHTTITRHIGVPIAQPFAFPVERHVALPFRVAVAIPVDRPFAVPVPRHFPVPIDRPFAVPVDRPVPVAVPHPVAVPFIRQVGVPIPQPFPVGVQTPVQVPATQPFTVPLSVSGGSTADLRLINLQNGISLDRQVGFNTV